MRKLKIVTTFNQETFNPSVQVVMNHDGVVTVLTTSEVTPSRYTAAQQATIDICNQALRDHGHPVMTEEEADHAVGKHLENLPAPTEEELQRLAGFVVNKTVTYVEQ